MAVGGGACISEGFLFRCSLFYYLKWILFICVSLCGYVRALVGGLREQIRVSGSLEFQAVGSPSVAGAGN